MYGITILVSDGILGIVLCYEKNYNWSLLYLETSHFRIGIPITAMMFSFVEWVTCGIGLT